MKDFLISQSARFQGGQLLNFGNLQSELTEAESGNIICPLLDRSLIAFSGNDARQYLQTQLTNDINQLDATSFQHSSWCTAKGRMLVNLLLYTAEGHYFALFSADLLEALLKRFQIYVLRSEVMLSNVSADYVLFGISGKNSAETLKNLGYEIPSNPMQLTHTPQATVLCLEPGRYILVVAAISAQTKWKALSAKFRPVGIPVWQWLNIQAEMPFITAATTEAYVPQMLDFDLIGGVSFKKGCYPGQEIIARARYLGLIKRHLYRVQTNHPVEPGARIYAKDGTNQACGSIVNAASAPDKTFVTLAVIKDEYAAQQTLRFETEEIKILTVTRCRETPTPPTN